MILKEPLTNSAGCTLAAAAPGRQDARATRASPETMLMSASVKRELAWLGIALLAGLVVFPLLVYATGAVTLGSYSRGGAGRFLSDFLRSLAGGKWQALVLAAAPIAAVVGWRIVRALRAPRRDHAGYVAAGEARDVPVRREPTL